MKIKNVLLLNVLEYLSRARITAVCTPLKNEQIPSARILSPVNINKTVTPKGVVSIPVR